MDSSAATVLVHGSIRTDSPDATQAIGRGLGRHATPGTVIALIGELGAGKTRLTKGIAEGLEVPTVVNSPTFVLMNEHAGRLRLYHVDVYRLDDPEEAIAAGLIEDRQADGVAVIEWADRLGGYLPDERLEIRIEIPDAGGDARELHWEARGATHERLAAEALDRP